MHVRHAEVWKLFAIACVTIFNLMKEAYFSPNNYEHTAREMYQRVIPGQRKRTPHFTPHRSALLVLDMQSYFLDAGSHAYIPSAEAIVPGLQRLTQAFIERDLPVFFTQHINSPEDAGLMATWWRDLITVNDPASQIIPELDFSGAAVIRKSQYDAFYKTSLEAMLRDQSVSQVVVCGVMTHLCCETTARSAFMHGFDVYFPVDGTATYNQEYHMATLLNLSHGFATLVQIGEILSILRGNDAG